MDRRFVRRLGLAALLLPALAFESRTYAEETANFEIQTLQQALEVGLKARQPQDFAFIGTVVALAQNGRLPLAMIETTFHWARRQHAYYPFPYFQQGLRIRARRIGVAL
jgi:hypothetical protein